MRASVIRVWPSWIERWEGRLSWMYLDTKYLVTTGTGNLIDSVAAAQALPWYTPNGVLATDDQVETEWRRVKALRSLASKSGWAYQASAQLFLRPETLDRLLNDVTANFWARLSQTLPDIESYPADAQLALIDLAWQNGPAFLDVMKDGKYVWSNTRPAVLAQDWAAASNAVPGTGDRANARKLLFANAAKVKASATSLDVLWYPAVAPSTTPAPPQPETPPSPSPPPPPQPKPQKGINMATATGVYARANQKDQVFKPGKNALVINNSGVYTLVIGPNAGVDVTVGIKVDSDKGGVIRLVLVDFKDGEKTTISHERLGESFPPGQNVERSARYAGSIGKSPRGGTLRLRAYVESEGDLTVKDVQSSGWKM